MIRKIYFLTGVSMLFGMVITPPLLTAAPILETKFNPAAAPMELLVALKTDETIPEPGKSISNSTGRFTAVWLSSQRLRPSCRYEFIDWRLGSRSGNNVPVEVAVGPPIVRGNGKFSAGPWVVQIQRSRLKETFADVYHSCSFLGMKQPWLTKSQFWN